MSPSFSAADEFVQAEIRAAQQAYRAGNLVVAASRVEDLYRRFPEHPEVLMARGMILAAQGEPMGALESYKSLLVQRPKDVEALAWAAFSSLNVQEFVGAEGYARRLIEVAPQNQRGYYLLANALRAQDRVEEGLTAIDLALAITPDDPESFVTKARLLQLWQMSGLATELYSRAMAIRPTPSAGMELAKMLLRDNHPAEALHILRMVEPMMPESSKPHGMIAEAQTQLREFEEASGRWDKATKTSADPRAVIRTRATSEIAVGRFDVAEELLSPLIQGEEEPDAAFAVLSTAKKMREDDKALIERMVEVSKSDALPVSRQIALNYALGKSFDDLRDYERAIGFFDEANRLAKETYRARQSFDRSRISALNDFLIANTGEVPQADASPSSLPLFVVGMIRSGTTLTETILGGHSMVAAGGEQAFWPERTSELIYRDDSGYLYDRGPAAKFAADYLNLIDAGEGIRYVIDKTPGNIDLAGILHEVLPNARFINLVRHPVDNLLSMWMTPVSGRVGFASDRSNLVFIYRENKRLRKHWQKVMPTDRYRTVRYEDLTSQPESTISGMLDYLGLEPEAAVFTPEKNERAVLTPSVYQVRQPIHEGSQARWKNYEPWLGEFATLLDDEP